MNRRKFGVLLSYLYNFIQIGINLLYVPLLLTGLGQSEYGLYQLVGAIIVFLNVFESTLSASLVKFYCKYKAVDDKENMENTLAMGRIVFAIFSCILLILVFGLMYVFETIYSTSLSGAEINEGKLILLVSIVNLIIEMNGYTYLSAIYANERFVFIRVVGIIVAILKPFTILLIINKFPYAFVVVLIQCIINIIAVCVRRYYARKMIGIKIKLHKMDVILTKEILYFTGTLFLGVIADRIFWQTDQLILGKLFGTATVAVYSVGMQICNCYGPLGTSISSVFMPKLSYMKENGFSSADFSDLFVKVCYIAFIILFLVLSGFGIFGRVFIQLWVGPGYENAYYIALLIMIPYTIDLMENIGLSILQVFDMYSFRAKIYFVGAFLNIFLTIILAKIFGEIGAALSTGIAIIITSGFFMNIYYKKYISINITELFKRCGMIIVRAILPIVFAIIMVYYSRIDNWILLAAEIAVYACLYYLIAIPKDLVREFFGSNFGKMGKYLKRWRSENSDELL